jgi:cell division protein FtsI (penicillin-binding protein 3)
VNRRRPIEVSVEAASEPFAVVRQRARARIRGVGGLLTVLMFAAGARGLQLAVDPDEKTLAIATDKRWAAVSTQGPRGEILDADGNMLAVSVRTPAIFVDPVYMREQEVDTAWAAAELARILEVPVAEMEQALASKGRYIRLSQGVHPKVVDELVNLGLTSKGLIIEENYRRYYPQGMLAAQVLGFINADGSAVQGMEEALDELLSGGSRVSQHRVDSRGKVLELEVRDERSIQGNTIYTTIDRAIQRAAERSLAEVMERSVPSWATAAVVEVKTGRVLALASTPGYNPNLPTGDFDTIRNRATSDAIEPGSVLKPFTMAAALEVGVARADEVLNTHSPYYIGRVPINDDHPHAQLTVSEMVKYSSNIGAAQLAQRVGADGLIQRLRAFGFGDRSGLQVFGESAGRRHPSGRLGPVELATISYGQGVTATALQLAMATATLANGGERMRPTLVDRVEDPYGEVRQEYRPVVVERVVSPETARAVLQAMVMVTEEGGTGTRAAIPGYKVGGKTGTAYKVKDGSYSKVARYATFIGFAPADDPIFAMAIIVDEPTVGSRYGGTVAAPVFAEVIGPALRARAVPPDPTLLAAAVEHDEAVVERPEVDPIRLSWVDGGWRLPDLIGRSMRDVLSSLQGADLNLQVDGTGVLASQDPPPGEVLSPGSVVSLSFR